MKRIFVVLAVFAATAGCHAPGQVPPSSPPAVNLTWTAPAASGSWGGCTTSSPCVYAISRALAANGSCPATTGTNYALIGTSASNATSYADPTASGSVCYIAQTEQGICPTASNPNAPCISQPSLPSNGGVPLQVPALPLAPSAPNVTATAEMRRPPAPTCKIEDPACEVTTQVVARLQ